MSHIDAVFDTLSDSPSNDFMQLHLARAHFEMDFAAQCLRGMKFLDTHPDVSETVLLDLSSCNMEDRGRHWAWAKYVNDSPRYIKVVQSFPSSVSAVLNKLRVITNYKVVVRSNCYYLVR